MPQEAFEVDDPWWGRWLASRYAVLAVPRIGGTTYPDRAMCIGVYPWLWAATLGFRWHAIRISMGLHPKVRIGRHTGWALALCEAKDAPEGTQPGRPSTRGDRAD